MCLELLLHICYVSSLAKSGADFVFCCYRKGSRENKLCTFLTKCNNTMKNIKKSKKFNLTSKWKSLQKYKISTKKLVPLKIVYQNKK